MEVFVLRRLETAGLGLPGKTVPWADRAIVPIEGRQRHVAWATVSTFNLLAGAVPAIPDHPISTRLAAWSGWLPEDSTPERGAFRADLRTWQPAARAKFDDVCDWLAPTLRQRELMLAIRPHARHVLSDAQGCITFLKKREGQPFELLVEPAAMLTPDMLPDAAEHLERIIDALARFEAVAGFLVSNVEKVDLGDGVIELRTCPISMGILDPDFVARPCRAAAGSRAIVLYEENLPKQLGIVRPAGRV